jgi:catabolite regulation protein CreA
MMILRSGPISLNSYFISKSQTGGVKGGLGLAEDTSHASVAVRQTGPIKVKEAFTNGEDAFTEKRSVLSKQLHVSRFWCGRKITTARSRISLQYRMKLWTEWLRR